MSCLDGTDRTFRGSHTWTSLPLQCSWSLLTGLPGFLPLNPSHPKFTTSFPPQTQKFHKDLDLKTQHGNAYHCSNNPEHQFSIPAADWNLGGLKKTTNPPMPSPSFLLLSAGFWNFLKLPSDSNAPPAWRSTNKKINSLYLSTH